MEMDLKNICIMSVVVEKKEIRSLFSMHIGQSVLLQSMEILLMRYCNKHVNIFLSIVTCMNS